MSFWPRATTQIMTQDFLSYDENLAKLDRVYALTV